MKNKLIILVSALLVSLLVFTGCSLNILPPGEGGGQSNDRNDPYLYPDLDNLKIDLSVGTREQIAYKEALIDKAEQEESLNLKTVLKTIRQSVVEVYAQVGSSQSAGSGVVIGNTTVEVGGEKTDMSYILTCHHVIEGASSASIKTIDGDEYSASLIGSDPKTDICVLSVYAKLLPVEFYDDTNSLEVGEGVVAIGNPLGTLGGTVTSGIISATAREINVNGSKMSLLQTDASINAGNSGGGLFTKSGYFVGMVNAKYSSSYSSIEGLGFAIPANDIKDIASQLIETKTSTTPGYIAGRYVIGCTVQDEYANRWGTQIYVVISGLEYGGSMHGSEFLVGDVLVSFTYKNESYTITNSAEFINKINSYTFDVGDEIVFEIERSSTRVTRTLRIKQYIYGI